jgi:hypothetical protein
LDKSYIENLLAFSSTIGLASLILYALTIDRLVKMLHDEHWEDWKEFGSPVGILYIPHDAKWRPGIAAQFGLVCDILLKTPAWFSEKPELMFLIKKVRWCLALAILSLIANFVLR